MAALSNYLQNHFIDYVFRAQTWTAPATLYFALFTSSEGAAGGGTEVSGGSYARVAVTGSLANWAGTLGAGNTAISTGTSGQTSNNNTVTFPAPSAAWGSVTYIGVFDASTSGNLYFYSALSVAKSINSGDSAPSFQAGAATFTFT